MAQVMGGKGTKGYMGKDSIKVVRKVTWKPNTLEAS